MVTFMSFQRFCEFLRKVPFEPFEVRLKSGDLYQVKDRTQAAVGKDQFFIAHAESDNFTSGSANDIVSVEKIPVFSQSS
jgi:hypothetical protein